MARDLIPPPSPAGRPGSSAEAERERARELDEQRQKQKGGLWHRSPEDEATAPPGADALADADGGAARRRPSRRAPTPPSARASGSCSARCSASAIATLAIGAAVYVGTTRDGVPDGWSGWRPTADDGEKAAQQIATHVGRQYRLADGNQLVGVQGGPLEIDALGLTVPLEIAMKTAPQGGDIDFIKGNGLLYTLNGLGPKGSVRGGKPSEERHLLLRREALELALYTFRYIDDVDLVVALLPPGAAGEGDDQEGRGRRGGDRGEADAGAVLPPRRPRAAARDPARRDDPAADPAPGDDRRAPRPAASTRSRAATCSSPPSSRGRTRRRTSCWTAYRSRTSRYSSERVKWNPGSSPPSIA